MDWILWICLTTSTGGACVTEKRTVAEDRRGCFEQLEALRSEPQSLDALTVSQATSIDIGAAPSGKTVAACLREPRAVVAK